MTQTKRRLCAIMFTDMVGYTALMQSDEAQAKLLRDRHRQVLERVIQAHDGEVIQYYGDGTLSIFGSAKNAVTGAIEIQQALGEEPKVPLRIGIHTGDIVYDKEGIYGDGVNVASRIESLSVPGAVLISAPVNRELKNHPDLRTVSLGTYRLKNVDNPVEVFALDASGVHLPAKQELRDSPSAYQDKSIAVMPLRTMGGDSEQEYFSDGISEEILNGLSKVAGLSIISRSSSFRLRNTDVSPMEIGQRLNVSHILEGSVRQAGNLVRVTVQLTNAADGFQLWSHRYERQLENIFEVQDDIARQVVNKLKENFGTTESQRRIIDKPTENTEAYTLYLKGLHHWNKWNPEEVQKAMQAFQSAVALDPHFANAYCAMAQCYAFLGSCGVMPPVEAYAKAQEYALLAVEKNADLAESHLAMAMIKFFHFWDWEGTRASLERADVLGLNSGMMHQIYALYLAMVGDMDGAVERMEKAVKVDPLAIPLICRLGDMYMLNGQLAKALAQFDHVLDLDPSFRSAIESKAIAMMMMGNFDDALDLARQYHAMVNNPLKGVTCLCVVHAERGEMEEARNYLDRLHERQQQEPQASLEIDFAIAYYALGDHEKAIENLHKVYEKRFSVMCTGMVFIMRCDYFKLLWARPGFEKLIDMLGLASVHA